MGTATGGNTPCRGRTPVGAYSITDGDCDKWNEDKKLLFLVGAYSITDGDCDKTQNVKGGITT